MEGIGHRTVREPGPVRGKGGSLMPPSIQKSKANKVGSLSMQGRCSWNGFLTGNFKEP